MTKDEALKMALEALEAAAEEIYCKDNDDSIAKAITAIKEVLAQPEQEKDWGAVAEKHLAALKQSSKAITEDAAVRAVHKMAQPEQSQVEETLRYEIDALEAKLAECRAQPEQEPEAWYDKHGMFTHDPFEGVTPLYTPPPQRTWVGLMDEEIVAICQSVFGIDPILDGNLRKYAKAFEAKLKQKNGYAEEENI